MERIELTLEDEYLYPPSENLLRREGYYFNGYDPESKTGISVKIEMLVELEDGYAFFWCGKQ